MVFEHSHLLSIPLINLKSVLSYIKSNYINNIYSYLIQKPNINYLNDNLLCIITKWKTSELCVSILSHPDIYKVYNYLIYNYGVRFICSEIKEYKDNSLDISYNIQSNDESNLDPYIDPNIELLKKQIELSESNRPVFQLNFGRCIDGIYVTVVVNQKTFIPADLIYIFYEPVSCEETIYYIAESRFDDIKFALGDYCDKIAPYTHREEWICLLLRLFTISWDVKENKLVVDLDYTRIKHFDDFPLIPDPKNKMGKVDKDGSPLEPYKDILQSLDEQMQIAKKNKTLLEEVSRIKTPVAPISSLLTIDTNAERISPVAEIITPTTQKSSTKKKGSMSMSSPTNKPQSTKAKSKAPK